MVDQIAVVKLATLSPAGTGVTAGQWNTIRADVDELLAGRALFYAGNYANLQAAIDDAAANGPATVALDPTTYVGATSFILKQGVSLWGMGREASELTIANGVDDAVLKSEDFDTLAGTDSTLGIHGFTLANLRINGNAANQTGSGTGGGVANGISVYGYDYTIDNVTIYNCADTCFYSEWGTSLNPPDPNGMEARIRGLVLHDAGLYNIFFDGPHDSQLSDLVGYGSLGGMYFGVKGSAVQVDRVHSYGATQNYAVYVDAAGATFVNLIAEGAANAQVFLAADSVSLYAFKIYKAGGAGIGIEIADGAKAYDIVGNIIDCAPAVQYTSDNGEGRIDILAYSASAGSVEGGSPHATSARRILAKGALTGTVDTNGT